jgi:hypothetical protein
MLLGLDLFIVTVETAQHRAFFFERAGGCNRARDHKRRPERKLKLLTLPNPSEGVAKSRS